MAAATTATLLIEHFQASHIVFTGVAGGLGKGVSVGDIVIADQFLQHDLNDSLLFPRYEIPGYGMSTLQPDSNLASELKQACTAVLENLTPVLTPETRAA